MKHGISALMDGELDKDTAQTLITRLKQEEELRYHWSTYHLIGDCLRQRRVFPSDLTHRFNQKLSLEPTILAPRKPVIHNTLVYSLSAVAASVSAVALVAWVALQNIPDRLPANLALNQAAPIKLPHPPIPSHINDYLIAHQEFSPATTIQGVAPYAKTVTEAPRESRR